ncbi:MAG: TIGR04255 family protein [Planctomycetes bacterium]|nr:TIGR04255 family protein [Planctomycetota bacterium]
MRRRDAPPILPQIEELDQPGGLKRANLQLVPRPPLPRVFFEHANGAWLIQLQQDRFLHNWREAPTAGDYPRYPAVRSQFSSQWSCFQSFIADSKLGQLNVSQLEMTYMNHISPLPDDLDIGDVFPDLRWRNSERDLEQPESLNVAYTFTSDNSSSRLRANIKPGLHPEKGKILLFDLTVRGTPDGDDFESWFDKGREWIVTAFADLTSDRWHKQWERTK